MGPKSAGGAKWERNFGVWPIRMLGGVPPGLPSISGSVSSPILIQIVKGGRRVGSVTRRVNEKPIAREDRKAGRVTAGAAGDDAGAGAGGRENSATDITMIVVGGAHSNCGPARSPNVVIRHWLCPTAPFGDESVGTCELMLTG